MKISSLVFLLYMDYFNFQITILITIIFDLYIKSIQYMPNLRIRLRFVWENDFKKNVCGN
jgi:hypothetical protein